MPPFIWERIFFLTIIIVLLSFVESKTHQLFLPRVTMIMRKGKRKTPLNRLYFIKLSMNIRSKSYARETDPKDKEVRHEQM